MAGRHSKVHELLDRAQLDELEEFAREPARTVDECREWLEAAGCRISRSAVHRWLQGFLSDDRLSAASEVARGYLAAARGDKGATEIIDAATLMVAQATQDTLIDLQARGAVETKDLQRISRTLLNAQATKREVERVRQEMADRQRAALAEADKAAKAGGSAEAVIGKVREILGIE